MCHVFTQLLNDLDGEVARGLLIQTYEEGGALVLKFSCKSSEPPAITVMLEAQAIQNYWFQFRLDFRFHFDSWTEGNWPQ